MNRKPPSAADIREAVDYARGAVYLKRSLSTRTWTVFAPAAHGPEEEVTALTLQDARSAMVTMEARVALARLGFDAAPAYVSELAFESCYYGGDPATRIAFMIYSLLERERRPA
jgi:hypothetical protein